MAVVAQAKKSKKKSFVAIRQCLGVDVSKDKIDICFMELNADRDIRIRGQRKLSNSAKGWQALKKYIEKFQKPDITFSVVMEATGVYYEGLAYFLKAHGIPRCVILPNTAKHYGKSLNTKTKNDKTDAQVLAQMGLERNLRIWEGMNYNLLTIKRLLREKEGLFQQITVVRNRLKAAQSSFQPNKETLKRLKKQLDFLYKQIGEIDKQVKELYKEDEVLKEKIKKVCSIKGVNVQTALTIVAETNGFELIKNKAQLVSYAGYDVVENQSGKRNGKTKISKKGNAHIRRALHMPAFTAVKHEPKLTKLYNRVLEKNPKTKMIAYVAVQRKLLVLIYTLFKNNTKFDPDFEAQKNQEK